MPLRAENRPLYGHAWRKYRLELIALAKNMCAICRQQFPAEKLTGAHIHHDPKRLDLVSVLCFTCHGRHDTPQRIAMTRRTRARRFGQLWLLPEIEYAPYPVWQIPAEILAGIQPGLFDEYAAAREPVSPLLDV